MAIAFDTLAYANKLKSAGVPEKQAEIQAEALAQVIDDTLATKQDLQAFEERLANRLIALEQRLTIRVGAMLAASIVIVASLVKLL